MELGALESQLPADDRLAAVTLPVRVLAGAETPPLFAEAAAWVAGRLEVAVTPSPGAHTPYFDRPHEFAATVRSCLRKVADWPSLTLSEPLVRAS